MHIYTGDTPETTQLHRKEQNLFLWNQHRDEKTAPKCSFRCCCSVVFYCVRRTLNKEILGDCDVHFQRKGAFFAFRLLFHQTPGEASVTAPKSGRPAVGILRQRRTRGLCAGLAGNHAERSADGLAIGVPGFVIHVRILRSAYLAAVRHVPIVPS